MSRVENNIVIENAKLVFRNFEGRGDQFNREGDRNFAVVIDDPAYAQKLIDDGWNIKQFKQREDGEEPDHYIPVAVSFKFNPPTVMMVTSRIKTPLNEDTIGTLDHAEIKFADVVIRPYNWEVSGKSGVKAYLKELYVTIEEDYFASKYADQESPSEDDDYLPDEIPFN